MDMKRQVSRLENEGGSKSRRNEQVARSEAECRRRYDGKSGYIQRKTAGSGEGGGGSQQPSPPSFLVQTIDNVNYRYSWAKGLITMWDFLEYKVRIGKTNILLNHKEDRSLLKIVPASCKSRYFDDGRWNIFRNINKRLGRFNKVKGLMVTLTFDPKKIGKREAWESFGQFTRAFLNNVNQYRKRRGWRRLHYLWVVEVQKGTGYPHVHVFFPNLKWLAPLSIIKGNWRGGRSNVESPKQLTTNCAGYIAKYLRKMKGWNDLHLALLWSGKARMYGFSRGFSVKLEKKESEWERLRIQEADDINQLEKSLEDGGYTIDRRLKVGANV
jgi:hypothetical protein